MVGRIATGQIADPIVEKSGRTRSGLAGAKARAEGLSGERRKQIARKAAISRWQKK